MDAWTIGLVVIVVLGVAAIVAGALIDRSRNRRAREEMLSPPDRAIPSFKPDQAAPHYLSELQARRPPAGASDRALSPSERDVLERQLRADGTVRVAAGLASKAFITDPPSRRAIMDAPLVLLCADEVGSVRELLPVMERCALSGRPLVIAAPALAAEVLATAEVNVIQRKLDIAVVRADEAARAMISELTAAAATTASDRQAGYFPPTSLGSAPRWVSSETETFVLTSADAESAP